MPSARQLKAGRAVIEMSLLTGPVEKGLKKLQNKLNKIGQGFTQIGRMALGAGGAITGAIGAATTAFAKAGDELNKMAARTGASVEELSRLDFAASQSGSSIGAVERSIRGMNRTILDAERGLSTATDNLSDLGLTLADLQGKSPTEQLGVFADRLSAIEDPGRRAALAAKVFGRSGADLLPLLMQGSVGIEEMTRRADELGLTLGRDDATAAAKLTDAIDILFRQFKAFTIQIGGAVAGPLTDFLKWIQPTIKGTIDWVKAHGELVRTVGKTGLAFTAIGGTLTTIGGLFSGLSLAVGALTTVFGGLTAAVTFVAPFAPLIAVLGTLGAAALAASGKLDGLNESIGRLLADTSGGSIDSYTKALEEAQAATDKLTFDSKKDEIKKKVAEELKILEKGLAQQRKILDETKKDQSERVFTVLGSGFAPVDPFRPVIREQVKNIAELESRIARLNKFRQEIDDATLKPPTPPETTAPTPEGLPEPPDPLARNTFLGDLVSQGIDAVEGAFEDISDAVGDAIGLADNAVNGLFGLIDDALGRLDAAQQAAVDRLPQPQAVFDATFAAQQFGSRGTSKELEEARKQTRILNAINNRDKHRQPGIPVGR